MWKMPSYDSCAKCKSTAEDNAEKSNACHPHDVDIDRQVKPFYIT